MTSVIESNRKGDCTWIEADRTKRGTERGTQRRLAGYVYNREAFFVSWWNNHTMHQDKTIDKTHTHNHVRAHTNTHTNISTGSVRFPHGENSSCNK